MKKALNFATKDWVRVKVFGKRPGFGYAKKESRLWFVRFDDGRSYSVPSHEVEAETKTLEIIDK